MLSITLTPQTFLSRLPYKGSQRPLEFSNFATPTCNPYNPAMPSCSKAMGSHVPPMRLAPPAPCAPTIDLSLPVWHFSDRLLTITHDALECETCSSWVHHYMEAVIHHDISLAQAESAWCTHFQADLVATRNLLTQNNDILRTEITALHDGLKTAKEHNDSLEEDLI